MEPSSSDESVISDEVQQHNNETIDANLSRDNLDAGHSHRRRNARHHFLREQRHHVTSMTGGSSGDDDDYDGRKSADADRISTATRLQDAGHEAADTFASDHQVLQPTSSSEPHPLPRRTAIPGVASAFRDTWRKRLSFPSRFASRSSGADRASGRKNGSGVAVIEQAENVALQDSLTQRHSDGQPADEAAAINDGQTENPDEAQIQQSTEDDEDALILNAHNIRSTLVPKLFVEQSRHFVAVDLSNPITQLNGCTTPNQALASRAAASYQTVFDSVAIFAQGMLAGASIWQLLTLLWEPTDDSGLRRIDAFQLRLFQTVYYVLAVVAIIGVLDRVDACRWFSRKGVKVRWMDITLSLVYPFGLALSFMARNTTQYTTFGEADWKAPIVWRAESGAPLESAIVDEEWMVLNTLRCLCAILGWLAVALNGQTTSTFALRLRNRCITS